MKKEKVRQDNINFFVLAVGIAALSPEFEQVVTASLLNHVSEFLIEATKYLYSGRIQVDSSAILKAQEGSFHDPEEAYYIFLAKIKKDDLLRKIANDLLTINDTKFQGELAEKVTMIRGGCKFSFYIKEYKRDLRHQSKAISLEALLSDEFLEDEKISRIVSLTISPDK